MTPTRVSRAIPWTNPGFRGPTTHVYLLDPGVELIPRSGIDGELNPCLNEKNQFFFARNSMFADPNLGFPTNHSLEVYWTLQEEGGGEGKKPHDLAVLLLQLMRACAKERDM